MLVVSVEGMRRDEPAVFDCAATTVDWIYGQSMYSFLPETQRRIPLKRALLKVHTPPAARTRRATPPKALRGLGVGPPAPNLFFAFPSAIHSLESCFCLVLLLNVAPSSLLLDVLEVLLEVLPHISGVRHDCEWVVRSSKVVVVIQLLSIRGRL